MPAPKDAGHPVRLINPFWRIKNVNFGKPLEILWNFGEFGEGTDWRVQPIQPLGLEVSLIGVRYMTNPKVSVFAIKRTGAASPTPARATQILQIFVGGAFTPSSIPNDLVHDGDIFTDWSGGTTPYHGPNVLSWPESTDKRWYSSFVITGNTSATITEHSLPHGAPWGDLLALAGLDQIHELNDDHNPIDGGNDDVIGLVRIQASGVG